MRVLVGLGAHALRPCLIAGINCNLSKILAPGVQQASDSLSRGGMRVTQSAGVG